MINAEKLNAIKERAAKATPGPWRSAGLYGVRTQNDEALSIPLRPSDATFIAHAREDVPVLVAEVERLQNRCELYEVARRNDGKMIEHKDAEIERLRKALEFYADEENYDMPTLGIEEDGTEICGYSIADMDNGKRAREALSIGEESNAL